MTSKKQKINVVQKHHMRASFRLRKSHIKKFRETDKSHHWAVFIDPNSTEFKLIITKFNEISD